MVPQAGQLGNLSQVAMDMLNDPAGDINPELLKPKPETKTGNEQEEVKVELMDGDEDIEEINGSESSNHGEI